MVDRIEIGTPPIAINVRHSARARRYSIRISNRDGAISLTVPKYAPMAEAIKFANTQEAWMRKHLAKQVRPKSLEFGQNILFDGRPCVIEPGVGRAVQLIDDVLQVPGHPDQVGAKLRAYYKVVARARMAQASQYYASLIGKQVNRITIRDTRSRWGSCTSDGNLMYSLRLVMAPVDVQSYVAAHEVCHLIEMNHSKAYWNLVESIFPDYKRQRAWLKKNGAVLHQYVFTP